MIGSLFHADFHSSHEPKDWRKESENQIVNDKSWQQTLFAEALRSTMINNHLCAVAQEEEESQNRYVEHVPD